MQTLDTNVLVRWLVRDNPDMTAEVDALFASGRRFRVPDVAVLETVFVLEGYYQLGRGDVADAIRLLIGQATLGVDRVLWGDIMRTYVDHPKLSCADIYLTLDARRAGAEPVISFDKKLITQLGAVSPDDA